MFKELGWLSATDRLKHNKATLIYKALNNKTSDYITNLLKPMSEVHTLNLRSTENGTLYVPRSRTSLMADHFHVLHPVYGILFLKQSEMLAPYQLLKNLLNHAIKVYRSLTYILNNILLQISLK